MISTRQYGPDRLSWIVFPGPKNVCPGRTFYEGKVCPDGHFWDLDRFFWDRERLSRSSILASFSLQSTSDFRTVLLRRKPPKGPHHTSNMLYTLYIMHRPSSVGHQLLSTFSFIHYTIPFNIPLLMLHCARRVYNV